MKRLFQRPANPFPEVRDPAVRASVMEWARNLQQVEAGAGVPGGTVYVVTRNAAGAGVVRQLV